MPPDLVIFDCDGVLADSEVLSAKVLIAELAREGVQIDSAYVRRHFLGRSFPTVARTIRDELGHPLPADFEHRYRQRLLALFEDHLRPTPGLLPMLERLTAPACVATSSSPERAARTLALLGLAGRFEGIDENGLLILAGAGGRRERISVADIFFA